MTNPQRLIVGISGASGIIYGIRILQTLADSDVETHLVMSESARLTLSSESNMNVKEVEALATEVHHIKNIGATIASGSFKTMGMVIAPCSIRSLSEISWGMTTSLLSRAADVVLKERRRLVLLVRETPLHAGHLKTMLQATENGAIIMPPVPAFYAQPETIDEMVNHTVGRCLDLFDIDTKLTKRWEGIGKKE
ncbi:flavin prenyltransferase UbiX [Polynucleobacter sp. SHI8]|uniref:UbiX family flavin prenyltransferase n=1 Tax=unclassified Polynucleobacter TaxID=2640945 RepID=UPI0024917C7A|nr:MULTISPECIES: UbiX family flavin prenyltransferase [unclassified Polynucleobacter]BDW11297.1 flavin prenyltransferase UbiX [Polynucleobacter sp. SHI2]BDW13743.1 flavin prenyltransferase UbiX [Polynucleobacter sp. SHI8]